MSEATSLTSLPGDIHFQLLCYLPNLSTLQSTILAHSTIYSTYLDYRTQILKSVFVNQVYTTAKAKPSEPPTSRRPRRTPNQDEGVVDIIIPRLDTTSSASASASKKPKRKTPKGLLFLLYYNTASYIISKLPINRSETHTGQEDYNYSPYEPLGRFKPKPPSSHADAETFYSAFWPIISKDLPNTLALSWGRDLICIYFFQDKLAEALGIALQIWDKSLSKPMDAEPTEVRDGSRRYNKDIYLSGSRAVMEHECINFLISVYRALRMDGEAIGLQKHMVTCTPGSGVIHAAYSLGLSQTYQSLGSDYLPTLITFQTETWELYTSIHGPAHSQTLDWARHLLITYNTNGMIQESLDFQTRVLNGLIGGSMEYISWSRGLIKAYQKLPLSSTSITPSPEEAILSLTSLTFQSYPSTSPGFIGWSRDLCQLLRAKNREEEALAVETRVWEEMKTRMMARPRDKGLAFRARGPGLVLAGSLRRVGRVEEAVRVESYAMV